MASQTTSASAFVETKIQSLMAEIEKEVKLQKELQASIRNTKIADERDWGVLKATRRRISENEVELFVLFQERKTFIDDMEDFLPKYETLEKAYSELITAKVMAANGQQARSPYNQWAFKRGVVSFYNAKRVSDFGTLQTHCHLLGWLDSSVVVAAHIVPKSLRGNDASYIFGVSDVNLSDPLNGITLARPIELALDKGEIVFVPELEESSGEILWRCVLLKKSRANEDIFDGPQKFQNIDGKYLTFVSKNRPAARYMYFRYLITYLHHKGPNSHCKWAENVEPHVWAVPGLHLRKSLLMSLARQCSDLTLPQEFYVSVFTTAPGSPEQSPEVEEKMLSTIQFKMKKCMIDSESRDDDDHTDEDDFEYDDGGDSSRDSRDG